MSLFLEEEGDWLKTLSSFLIVWEISVGWNSDRNSSHSVNFLIVVAKLDGISIFLIPIPRFLWHSIFWLMQSGTFKELVSRSTHSVLTSNWRLEKEVKRDEAIWRLLTSMLQYFYILHLWINKELSLTVMQCLTFIRDSG